MTRLQKFKDEMRMRWISTWSLCMTTVCALPPMLQWTSSVTRTRSLSTLGSDGHGRDGNMDWLEGQRDKMLPPPNCGQHCSQFPNPVFSNRGVEADDKVVFVQHVDHNLVGNKFNQLLLYWWFGCPCTRDCDFQLWLWTMVVMVMAMIMIINMMMMMTMVMVMMMKVGDHLVVPGATGETGHLLETLLPHHLDQVNWWWLSSS